MEAVFTGITCHPVFQHLVRRLEDAISTSSSNLALGVSCDEDTG